MSRMLGDGNFVMLEVCYTQVGLVAYRIEGLTDIAEKVRQYKVRLEERRALQRLLRLQQGNHYDRFLMASAGLDGFWI